METSACVVLKHLSPRASSVPPSQLGLGHRIHSGVFREVLGMAGRFFLEVCFLLALTHVRTHAPCVRSCSCQILPVACLLLLSFCFRPHHVLRPALSKLESDFLLRLRRVWAERHSGNRMFPWYMGAHSDSRFAPFLLCIHACLRLITTNS